MIINSDIFIIFSRESSSLLEKKNNNINIENRELYLLSHLGQNMKIRVSHILYTNMVKLHETFNVNYCINVTFPDFRIDCFLKYE